MNAPLTDELRLTRFAHEFQRNSGSREMVEHEEGEYVRFEDVQEMVYELHLKLGFVFHACSNHDDASEAAELLEPILEQVGAFHRG